MFRERLASSRNYQWIVDRLDMTVSMLDGKVSFDVDGVEVRSSRPAVERFNRLHGTNYGENDLIGFFAMVEWVKIHCLDVENPLRYAIGVWNNSEVFRSAPAEQGALILSSFLGGLRVHRITSRPGEFCDDTIAWYRENMPWVDPEHIHVQQEEGRIGTDFKAQKIADLGIKYHIDDSYEQAEEIVQLTEQSGTVVVLVPQLWNKGYRPETPRIITTSPEYYDFDKPESGLPKLVASFFTLADYMLREDIAR
jgi:hypothetical protein